MSLGSWAPAVGAVLSPFVGVGVCSSQGDRPDLGENETVFTEARSVPVKRPGRTAGRARRAEPNVGGVRGWGEAPLPRSLGGVPAAPTNPCHAGGQSGVETHTDRQTGTHVHTRILQVPTDRLAVQLCASVSLRVKQGRWLL